MKKKTGKLHKSKLSKANKRMLLSGILVAALLGLSGCGNSEMDPLGPPTEISYTRRERETTVVEKGNITPTFTADLSLSGYEEKNYSIDQGKMDEIEMLYKAKFGELMVEEGDKVNIGDTLLSFESEILDKRSKEWESTKTTASLKREHLQNLQALDEKNDYYDDILDLNNDITLANQYVSDVNDVYSTMNIIADKEGYVSFIDESVKDGFIVTSAPIIRVVSDDGYYVLDRSTKQNRDKIKEFFDITSEMEFKPGDRFEARYNLNEYEVEVIEDPNATASSTDAASSDKVYFKLVNDVPLKDKSLKITKELPEIKDACYVDKRAVFIVDNETYVYKVMDDGFYKAVKVTTGELVGLNVVIREGLEEGETVVIID